MLSKEQFFAIKQLHDNPLFSKAFEAMNEKYKKTGRYSGKIKYEKLSDDEKFFLAPLDINILDKNSADISIQNFFKKKVLTGILEDVTMDEFWENYNEKKIITNKEVKDNFESKRNIYFGQLMEEYADTDAGNWLAYCLENKKYGYRQIIRIYGTGNNVKDFMSIMKNIMSALNNYPKNELLSIPIFATRITKDPHYFDYGSESFNLLMQGFCFLSGDDYPDNTEGFQNLMIKFGLVKDLVSNQIVTFNIVAIKNGKIHEGIEHFNALNEVLALTLKNIIEYDKITVKNNMLFVFENPSVFSAIAEEFKNISIICTSGNLKLSAITFLDKTVENCDNIYYSGDLDPEGLIIADYLKKRYGEKLVLWRMSREDYNFCMSQVELSDRRLSKLKSITDLQLKETAEAMSTSRKAGYQEFMLALYVEDIKKQDLGGAAPNTPARGAPLDPSLSDGNVIE